MSEPVRQGRSGDGAAPPRRRIPWDRVLVWFMRLVASAWIAKGLAAWLVILGVETPWFTPLTSLPLSAQAMVVVFAVLDPVAGVGLWLTSTWGGVMWLLAVMVHVVFAVLRPDDARVGLDVTGAEMVLVLSYVGLSWLASREEA
jgi:fatty acid desaturase